MKYLYKGMAMPGWGDVSSSVLLGWHEKVRHSFIIRRDRRSISFVVDRGRWCGMHSSNNDGSKNSMTCFTLPRLRRKYIQHCQKLNQVHIRNKVRRTCKRNQKKTHFFVLFCRPSPSISKCKHHQHSEPPPDSVQVQIEDLHLSHLHFRRQQKS